MKAAKHTAMNQFASHQGELMVNHIPITRLSSRVGQTPYYAYDSSVIKQQLAHLRQSLPSSIKLHYAIKANPMPALVCYMAKHLDGLDVASGQELHLALDSLMSPEHISFAGPGKSQQELSMALAAGVTLNLESITELERVIQLSKSLALAAKVAIRVNPNFELKTSGMKMGGGAQQFGVDLEQVPAMLAQIQSASLEFMGLHIFAGSQNLNADALIEAHNQTFAL